MTMFWSNQVFTLWMATAHGVYAIYSNSSGAHAICINPDGPCSISPSSNEACSICTEMPEHQIAENTPSGMSKTTTKAISWQMYIFGHSQTAYARFRTLPCHWKGSIFEHVAQNSPGALKSALKRRSGSNPMDTETFAGCKKPVGAAARSLGQLWVQLELNFIDRKLTWDRGDPDPNSAEKRPVSLHFQVSTIQEFFLKVATKQALFWTHLFHRRVNPQKRAFR